MAGPLTRQELETHGLMDCDPRDLVPLDLRIFGGFLSDHEPGQAVEWLRETLAAGTHTGFAAGFACELRCAIADVRNGLRFPCGDGLPEPADIHRLRANVREAIACITAWVDAHGIESLDTPLEDAAARQGWPEYCPAGLDAALVDPRYRTARLLGQALKQS